MYVQQIANPDNHYDWAYCLLDGTIQHQIDWQELINNKGFEITVADITTRESSYDGTVKLKYSTKLK